MQGKEGHPTSKQVNTSRNFASVLGLPELVFHNII